MKSRAGAARFAAAIGYLHLFVTRTAPGMIAAQLSDTFGLNATVASFAGVFYYGYSRASLVAGWAHSFRKRCCRSPAKSSP
jgi:hypothetical protein